MNSLTPEPGLPFSVPSTVEQHESGELLECLSAPIRSSPVCSETFLSLGKPLVELVSISRSTEGRTCLSELKVVPLLVVLFQNFHEFRQKRQLYSGESSADLNEVLLLLLKLARNMCAGDSTSQDAFLENDGVGILAITSRALLLSVQRRACRPQDSFDAANDVPEENSMLERVTALFGSAAFFSEQRHVSVSPPLSCLQMMLQLLGNFVRRGESSQAAAWEEFFPHLLLELAALRVEEICGALSMVLYTCSKNNLKRCYELCQGDGAALVALLMTAAVDSHSGYTLGIAASSPQQIEWFELLIQQVCLGEPLFPLLFTNLGVPPLSQLVDLLKVNTDELLGVCQLCLETSSLTSLQANLLYILCDSLNNSVSDSPDFTSSNDENEEVAVRLPMPAKSMCFLVGILRRAAECAVKDAERSPVPALTTGSCTVQIVGFVLSLLRILFAWDSSNKHRTQITAALLSCGLVELLLSMLEALGPPETPGQGRSGGMSSENRAPREMFSHKNLYQGYRRDIVAVIANASHQSFLVQDRVRENGSLLLVLQQCVVERDNPFLREWGLWAMRNLLEGNKKNQDEIAELELRESINLPELRKMGLNVHIDPNTRRPRLVNENSSSSQA